MKTFQNINFIKKKGGKKVSFLCDFLLDVFLVQTWKDQKKILWFVESIASQVIFLLSDILMKIKLMKQQWF